MAQRRIVDSPMADRAGQSPPPDLGGSEAGLTSAPVPAGPEATELEALRQVSLSLAASLELEDVLDTILESALKLLPEAGSADIFVYRAGKLSFGASRTVDGKRGQPWSEPRPEGLTYSVARSGRPWVIPDVAAHPLFANLLPGSPLGAIIGLPLAKGSDVLGVMNVAYRHAREFSDGELRLTRLLSDQAAAAIQNAWLYETARRQLKELAVLHQVAVAGSEATDEDTLIERATRIIGEELFPDSFGVLLVDPTAGVLRTHPSYQGISPPVRRQAVPLGSGVTGAVALEGRARRLADVSEAHDYVEFNAGTRSELCVPLRIGDHILGVINAESERLAGFTEADERLLVTLAGQLAQSIERLRAEAAQRHATLRSAESRAVLYRASQEISGSLDPHQVYAATHRAVAQLMPCHAFLIAVIDEEAQNIELVYATDRGREVPVRRVGLLEGLSGYVLATGRSLRINTEAELANIQPVRFGDPEHVASLVAEPMRLRGQVFGMISAQSYRPNSYSPEDLQMLSLLANQAAVAIEHARLYEAQREQRQLAEVLRETGAILSASLELDAVLDRLLEQVARVVPYDTGTILLVEGDRLRIARQQGYERLGEGLAEQITGLTFERTSTATLRQVIESGEPLIIPDTREFAGWVEVEASRHIRSWIGSPLVAHGEVIAVFALDHRQPHAFQSKHARHLATFSGHAALAVKNAQLYEAERRRVAALTALHETGLAMSQQLELAALLQTIVRRAAGLLGANGGGLYLLTPDGAMLECVVSQNLRHDYTGVRLRLDEGVVGRVVARGEPLVVDDYPAWPGRAPVFEDAAFRSVLGTPVAWQGRGLGALIITDERPHVFEPGDEDVARLFAAQAAVAIVNARLYADVRGQATELGRLFAAAQEMGACREPAEVLEVLAKHLTQGLQVSSTTILEVSLPANRLHVLAEFWSDHAGDLERMSDLGRAYDLRDFPSALKAATTGHVLALQRTDARLSPVERAELYEYGVHSVLIVPIIGRGEVLGEAELWESRVPREFTSAERRLAQTMVHQAADLIENVRLIAALESEKGRLELLYNLSQRLTASLDLSQMAAHALDLVRTALAAPSAQLYVPEPGEQRLWLAAASGEPAGSLGSELADRTAAARDLVVVPGPTRDAAWAPGASAAGVPLLLGDDLMGVLTLTASPGMRLGDDHRPILSAIAAPIALALQNARLYEAETQRARHLSLLNDITRTTIAELDLPEMLRTLTGLLAQLFAADACYLTQWDAERRVPIPTAAFGELAVTYAELDPQPGEVTMTESALQAGHALVIPDARNSPYVSAHVASLSRATSMLALPLVAGGRPLGAAIIAFNSPHTFTATDVSRGEQAAGQVALAIARAQLFAETRRRADELGVLAGVSSALRAARTVDDMLPILLQKACEVTGADLGGIYLVDPVTGELVRRGCHPPNPAMLGGRYAPGQGITGRVAATGQMYYTPDLTTDPLADLRDPVAARYLEGVRSNIGVPLRSAEGVVGVMQIATRQPRAFTPTEIHLLTAIAEIAANALQRAGLLETLEQRVAERTQALAAANERLQHLDRLKDQFISNVSHELRTPLTNIKLHLSLLDKRGANSLDKYLPTLQRETERLRRLIEDLLDLSRLQAQTMPPRREQQSLDGLIGEVVALHVTRAEARGLTLEHVQNAEPLRMEVDRAQMLQVLTNLVGNAVNYTPAGGHVRIASAYADREGQHGVEVLVHNSSVSIPPEDMPHLFERFFRGKTGLESGEAGTGLGLSICREIVEQHGGTIGVHSTEAGGTTFTFWLPFE
jgi:GAF domain-containing protein